MSLYASNSAIAGLPWPVFLMSNRTFGVVRLTMAR